MLHRDITQQVKQAAL